MSNLGPIDPFYIGSHINVCRIRDDVGSGLSAMKSHKGDIVIQRLDEGRFALAVDGVVRYVGSQEECERRAAILAPKNDRAAQDQALARVSR